MLTEVALYHTRPSNYVLIGREKVIVKTQCITKDERNNDLLNIKASPATSLTREVGRATQISNCVPRCLLLPLLSFNVSACEFRPSFDPHLKNIFE
jgi:hypothetical protein